MTGVVSDTHATIWFLSNATSLSATARLAMTTAVAAGGSIVVASITLVEITYLIEKSRIDPAVMNALNDVLDDPLSGFVLAPLDRSVAASLLGVPRDAVPDMPDRIIAATALRWNLPLVSRDRKIQASTIPTIW